jgi:hypothetical protein
MTGLYRNSRISVVAFVVGIGLALVTLLGESTGGVRANAKQGPHAGARLMAATPPPECAPEWRFVPSPEGTIYRQLVAVSALSERDVWAVGSYYTALTLAMHWDGTAWTDVPTPNIMPGHTTLTGVAAVSPNDVWAVGSNHPDPAGYPNIPMIIHWDGQSWQMVSLPQVPGAGPGGSALSAISAVSAADIWAVGYYIDAADVARTLTMHWNGAHWTVVPSPNLAAGPNVLVSVAAIATGDVWAVGSTYNLELSRRDAISMRWNGSAWVIVPVPHSGAEADGNILKSVSASTSNNVWAVGFAEQGLSFTSALTMKFDGTGWSVVWAPNPGDRSNYLGGVTALTPQDVWAVGYHNINIAPEGGPEMGTMVQKWNGSTWTVMPSPDPGTFVNFLFAVDALTGNTVWAVGRHDGGIPRTLTLRYSEQVFADVPPSDTFYPYTRCLACRDVDSGYACGGVGEPCDPFNTPYFRPNTLITRGDLCHMVAGAAGFVEPPGEQRFEDVPPSHPFFAWINRMAVRGLIGGYVCGGSNEPCVPPGNRPYFRPSNHATRGQIAKIVSNAAGFNEPVEGYTFQDVPTGQTFYVWVQRLASRGVMGGYPCGGPGEPCGSQNRPYFRWYNDATRGQVSKITANTFFPECSP